jgi:hypothetical protein
MLKLTKRSKQLLSVIFLLSVGIFVQNCDYSSDSPSLNVLSLDEDSANNFPFAYDLDIDHIAYMSCRGTAFSGGGGPFFSFKAGGFESGSGVKFRESFLESFGSLNSNRLKSQLNLSPRNKGAGVVMSVRETRNFQNVLRFSEADGSQDIDGSSLTGLMYNETNTLTNSTILDVMVNSRFSPLNYLRGFQNFSSLRTFDGSINLFSVDDQSSGNGIPTPPSNSFDQTYRNALDDEAYLAFTFATNPDEVSTQSFAGLNARSPFGSEATSADARTSVWGKGYQFTFSEYDNFINNSFRQSSQKRAISSVRAYNLENEAQINENWACPVDQKYIIVRRADALRRYDGVGINPNNHPINDDASALNQNGYNDGDFEVGGYYYANRESSDRDGDGELDFIRKKVICPMLPDQIPADDTPENRAEIEAWKRIRRILPVEDWFVFRGPKYNCIVPKNVSGDSCYGGASLTNGFDPQAQRNLIQYFADEDHPDIRIFQERMDIDDENITIDEIEVTPDCGTNSDVSHGGRNYCPHVLTVCNRQN